MPHAPRVITVSLNPALDLVIEVPGLAVGAHVKGRTVLRQPAGKGVNVSRALARLGRPSIATGFVGREDLAEYHPFLAPRSDDLAGLIGCDFVPVAERTRVNITLVDPLGRTDTHIRQAGAAVTAADLNALGDRLTQHTQPGDIIVFCGSLPPGMTAGDLVRLVTIVSERGGRAAIDVGGDVLRDAFAAGLPRVWMLKPNRDELAEVVGAGAFSHGVCPPPRASGAGGTDPLSSSPDAPLRAAESLRQHADWVAVTLGDQGAILLAPTPAEAPRAADSRAFAGRLIQDSSAVIDTVGCGDCFLAGLIDAYLSGLDAAAMLRRALAVAAANTHSPGAANFDPAVVRQFEAQAQVVVP